VAELYRRLIYNIFKRILAVISVSGLGILYILHYGEEAFLAGLGLSSLFILATLYCLKLAFSD
jgi:hypothetical protein